MLTLSTHPPFRAPHRRFIMLRQRAAGLVLVGTTMSTAAVAQSTSTLLPSAEIAALPSEEVHTLRALLELEAVFLLGWFYYLTTADIPGSFDVNYDWDVFRRKITGQSFYSDTNHFGTNFVGHPLGGAGYYQSARSNGMGIGTSSAFAFVGSALWELFGEVREEVSMNDTIVTPLAGIAIGETTFQLANFFDRSSPSWYHRGLGLLLGPFTTLHHAVDGTAPTRTTAGYPPDTWSRLGVHVNLAQVREGLSAETAAWHPEIQLGANVRVEGFAPFRARGERTGTFWTGEVSHLGVDVHVSRGAPSHISVDLGSVLTGVYYSSARHETDRESGYLGLGMGFTYTMHRYARGHSAAASRLASTRPLHLATGHHVSRGPWFVNSWIAAGPAFGGVDALALKRTPEVLAQVPGVTRKHGYYFGLGGFSQADLEVGYGRFNVGGSFLSEAYAPSPTPGGSSVGRISDWHTTWTGYLGTRIPGSNNELRLFSSFRDRRGNIESLSEQYREMITGLGLTLRPAPLRSTQLPR